MTARPASSQTSEPRRFNWRVFALALVAGGVAVFIAANAHLVIVAIKSQPDCVARVKTTENSQTAFSAAKPSC